MENKKYTYEELREIVHRLRKECPWDSVQTHKSLENCLLEESYEVLEAIEKNDGKMMADEFGDLLMQILLHAEIGAEEGTYTFEDICDALATKMVRRHPAIFNPGAECENWEEIKKKEKKLDSEAEILENISKFLPALQRSMKFSKKMSEWEKTDGRKESYAENIKEILRKSEKNESLTDADLGALLYAASGFCGCFDRSPEIILNNFLENFAKTLEK